MIIILLILVPFKAVEWTFFLNNAWLLIFLMEEFFWLNLGDLVEFTRTGVKHKESIAEKKSFYLENKQYTIIPSLVICKGTNFNIVLPTVVNLSYYNNRARYVTVIFVFKLIK